MCNLFPQEKFKYLLLSILLAAIVMPAGASITQVEDSILLQKRDFSSEELVRGERLFFGLVYFDSKSINCAACHNTHESDTLNWNPNALEIAEKYHNLNAKDLSRVLLNPSGKKMSEVHYEFQISPEDITLIKAYMDEMVEIGLVKNKPVITNLLLFIIASFLFLFSLADMIVIKIVKLRWINYLILISTGVFISYTLVVDAIAIGRSPGYGPDQPVKFSHAVHAGQNGTDCLYCHSSATYSKTAGIPSENVCMNCHLLVRNGTRSGAIEIAKVISAYENLKPMEWVKVYNLPDHVFFSHAQHVGAGGVNCNECHGEVQTMDIIKQSNDLSMGWCISCHRSREVNFRNNMFYSEYKDLADKLKRGEIDSVTVDKIGGIECMKCHY